ncbi:MFS transporter [Alkalibacterium kapii]|uniref:MFS transporter n=1 Tax=Alkalibacterium kapii TaxID=426704 RepID=A0A511AV63_9LACT|nr:MFS transporter [Alkalibacterium kapii]GEK92090.1 MFS transporter [Alkalibacterium kapii]
MISKSMKHWIVAVMMCGIAISAVGLPVMTNGVFITPIADSLNVFRGSVAMHNTLSLFMKAVMSLYVPRLIKRFGFKRTILAGVLLAGGSNYLMGWSGALWQFNILGFLRGVGTGLLAWVPLTIVINEWFNEKHGLVTSIVLSFSSIGGAIFSPVFSNLITSIGWEQSYRFMGILIVLFSLPALIVPYTLNPRDSGYLPYGTDDSKEGQAKDEAVLKRDEQRDVSLFNFGLLFMFTLLQTLLIGIPQHFPGFVQSIGYTSEIGATMLSIAMVSSIGFKLGLGYVSDYWGPVKSTVGVLMLIGLSSFILFSFEQISILNIGAFLFGAAYSIPSVSVTLLTKEFFGRYHFTRLYPILAFSNSLGGAISISAVGFIYDFTGSYSPAFAVALGINLLNMLVIFLIVNRLKSNQSIKLNS